MKALKAKYAPENAKNDPKGLNKHWLEGVNKFYNYLEPIETPEENASLGSSLTAK